MVVNVLAVSYSRFLTQTTHRTTRRNLLTGKGNSVPLVIDLAEFIPDGSPHFVPVQDQELTNLLLALKQNSLRPIAVTSSRGMMENSIEHIAGMVGLPNVMSARGASMQATTVEVSSASAGRSGRR